MRVLALGEVTVDWLSLECGKSMLDATAFYRYLGGNAANVAVVAARLGLNVGFIAKIGDDFHGKYLLSLLTKEGMDLSHLQIDSRYPTAQCYMTRLIDGSPVYCNWPSPHAAQMLGQDEISESVFADADLLHCTGISLIGEPRRSAIARAVALAGEHEVVLAYDACFPTGRANEEKDIAWKIMQRSDILKMNLDELSFWSSLPEGTDIDVMADSILQTCNPAALIITLAAEGAQVYTKQGKMKAEPFTVKCVSDVGAGDAFMAGLYYGIGGFVSDSKLKSALYDLDLAKWQKILRPACLAGALATRFIGATENFPVLDEFKKHLQADLSDVSL